jgi:hypothetical protein
MPSALSKVYTHKNHGGIGMEDPLYPKRFGMLTKNPEYADVMSGYVADFPQVKAAVNKVATQLALVAGAQLNRFHSDQKRSSNPRIEVVQGFRSDVYVLLVAGPEGKSPKEGAARSKRDERGLAAAWSIEYGRLGYWDKKGRWQPPAPGTGALHAALAAVGW